MNIKIPMTIAAISLFLLVSCSDNSTSADNPPKKEFAVVINELMASNQATVKDPQGKYEDWVELYNTSDVAVSLDSFFLTDNMNKPTKWMFPIGTVIEPKGYLMVWCDEDTTDAGIHSNFKLAKEGEEIFLFEKASLGSAMLDSCKFGEQETDVSYGRIPNGTGYFKKTSVPTPGKENK